MQILTKRLFLSIFLLICITSTLASLCYPRLQVYLNERRHYKQVLVEARYTAEAANIVEYYFTKNIPVSYTSVYQTLKAIDQHLPILWSTGPYTREDFIALAMVESKFDQYAVGSRNEKGIFQIMDDMSRAFGVKKNQFDLSVNTQLAMLVLREKYNQHNDYRKGLIAYNGYNVNDHGRVVDTYWKAFVKNRTELQVILGKK